MESDPYINAGVLLIDLKKWRSEQTGLQILNYYAANNGKLFANDQDAINGTLRQKSLFYRQNIIFIIFTGFIHIAI